MKKYMTVIMLLFALLWANGCSGRRETKSQMQKRDGLVFFVNEQKPYTGLFYDTYANGQLMEELPFKDGKPSGTFRSWYENGKLRAMSERNQKGQIDGCNQEYFGNGQLHKEFYCKDDKLTGAYKEWYENGQLKEEFHCENGKITGIWKRWFESGSLKDEVDRKSNMSWQQVGGIIEVLDAEYRSKQRQKEWEGR